MTTKPKCLDCKGNLKKMNDNNAYACMNCLEIYKKQGEDVKTKKIGFKDLKFYLKILIIFAILHTSWNILVFVATAITILAR